jgi:hypothetical protein
MPHIRQIIFLFFCLSNISLSINPTVKNSDKKIKTIPFYETEISEEAQKNINDIFEDLELRVQSNNQNTHFILIPLHTPDMPEIPTLATDPEEQAFIAKLGIDILRFAERSLITREDYIAEYADEQSLKAIHEYKKKCILLQQKGDIDSLFSEINRLHSIVIKNGDRNTITDYICLAIAEKFYINPIASILHKIRHASLEKAYYELIELRIQILRQAIENNITHDTKTRELLIEQYGFDPIHAARNCYMSRNDHVDITNYQFILSNNLKLILSTIQRENLPIAHAELIHLKKQILEHLESRNIIDPIAQKNYMIKNFGCDVIKLAHNIYRGRLDHKTLICYFEPFTVQSAIIYLLNDDEHNYESLAHLFHQLTQCIFRNAELSSLNSNSKIKTQIYEAIHVIKEPQNNAEFILNVTLINRMLENIQNKVDAIVYGEQPLSERPLESFTQAVKNFLTRLNQEI